MTDPDRPGPAPDEDTLVAAFYATCSLEETARACGVPLSRVRDVVRARVPDHRVLTALAAGGRGKRFTDDELVDALRAAAGAEHLSYAAYEAHVGANPVDAQGRTRPGAQAALLRFGSWNAALAAAGLATHRAAGPRRGGRRAEFDEEAVLAAVVACWRAAGGPPSASSYDAWQKERRTQDPSAHLPSAATARKIGGSWSALLGRAWQEVHGIRLGG